LPTKIENKCHAFCSTPVGMGRFQSTTPTNIDAANFIILDESFVYSDSGAIDNIPQIFDYINKQYNSVLVISHNPDIIKQFNNSIKIKNDGVFSSIVYT
jgi:DNA repair exonuclease SbcCD ATPase subunit